MVSSPALGPEEVSAALAGQADLGALAGHLGLFGCPLSTV